MSLLMYGVLSLALSLTIIGLLTIRSKRALRILLRGELQFTGGPLHGRSTKVPRSVAIRWTHPEWPDVFREADGSITTAARDNQSADEFMREVSARNAEWIGYYKFPLTADSYEWVQIRTTPSVCFPVDMPRMLQ